MKNIIIILVLLMIVTGIVWYLVHEKKQGATCIGCPYAKQCAEKNKWKQCVTTDAKNHVCGTISKK